MTSEPFSDFGSLGVSLRSLGGARFAFIESFGVALGSASFADLTAKTRDLEFTLAVQTHFEVGA